MDGGKGLGSRSKDFFLPGFLKNIFYLFITTLGLHCCAQTFSGCGEWGLLSSCDTQACFSDFSCCGARALGHRLSCCDAQA